MARVIAMFTEKASAQHSCEECFDSKVFAARFDSGKKAKRRKEVFPEDCRKAFDMGVRLAGTMDRE
jgi:hypothetical protein